MNDDLKAHIVESLGKGIRFDGRRLDEFRKIEVSHGFIKTAEGSARVKIGDTEILAGIKMGLEKPYPDTPEEGTIMVEAELLPLSSPDYEPGPPDIKSVETARIVDRGIRESKTIDMKSLLITKGEKAWSLNIDCVSINDAGNLIDCFGLGALMALKDAKYPAIEDGAINYKHKTNQSIKVVKSPIPITVLRIGKYYVVDPTIDEEQAMDARLTVASMEDGKICALQKGGDGELTLEDIERMVELGIEKAKELRAFLK
jgi:exosome complex component RRP42